MNRGGRYRTRLLCAALGGVVAIGGASLVGVVPASASGAKLASNPAVGVTGSTIEIGWMGDLTGPTASSQVPDEVCTQAYFNQVNNQGGVAGKKLKLLPQTDTFTTTKGIQNYHTLVDADHVFAIESMGGGQISQPLAPTVTQQGVTVIDPPQTTTPQVKSPSFLNAQATYGAEAQVGVTYVLTKVPATKLKMATVVLNLPDGLEYSKYVKARLKQVKAKYLGTIQITPASASAVAQVSKLQQLQQSTGLNYIAWMGSAEILALLTTEMKKVGLDVPIVGIHTTVDPVDGGDAVGTTSFVPGTGSAGAKALAKALKGTKNAKYATTTNCIQGWVNGMITKQVIQREATQLKGKQPTRAALAKAIRTKFKVTGLTCPVTWTKSNVSPCAVPMVWTGSKFVIANTGTLQSWSSKITPVYGSLKLG